MNNEHNVLQCKKKSSQSPIRTGTVHRCQMRATGSPVTTIAQHQCGQPVTHKNINMFMQSPDPCDICDL